MKNHDYNKELNVSRYRIYTQFSDFVEYIRCVSRLASKRRSIEYHQRELEKAIAEVPRLHKEKLKAEKQWGKVRDELRKMGLLKVAVTNMERKK